MDVDTNQTRTQLPSARPASLLAGGLAIILSLLGGLATGRLLYEWLFPDLLWLGRPLTGLLFAAVLAPIGWLLWRALARSLLSRSSVEDPAGQRACYWNALLPFLPLLLNLGYLLDPAVNLERSRFLFLASAWLAVVFLARLVAPTRWWRWLAFVLIVTFLLPVYLATMGRTVGMADTFEFQVVVPQSGIVHPTGYPLYLLLAKPFTWLPLNDVAWRVNLATLIFGLIAICLLYTLIRRLTGWIVPALLAAVLFGLAPTFWSQAIEAEVYSLHAAIVAGALLLMREIGGWQLGTGDRGSGIGDLGAEANDQLPVSGGKAVFQLTVLLAFVLGLGLTNHLTTVILLPAAGLTLLLAYKQGRYHEAQRSLLRSILIIAGAFLLPLLLYAYLPVRWAAVNGEPMGAARFVDWVIGGRFQGALQLTAWLRDSARYEIVGRLLTDEWPVLWGIGPIMIGLAALFYRQWRFGLILTVTWLGYTFYALNYYVPDLAVFLIPAYLIMAVYWAVGLVTLLEILSQIPWQNRRSRYAGLLQATLVLLIAAPALVAAGQTWAVVDSSADDGRTRWGQAVLDLPLPAGAAILADSEKFPPLYYLQQAEGQRPDLDIVVLPDEAAYRAELSGRLADGQPVYLARFVPGLEGSYHLRSLGPLTEVGLAPAEAPSDVNEPLVDSFGPIQLLGYHLAPKSPFAEGETAVTFYWQATEPLEEILQVYTRWAGDETVGPATGQHPAGNNYPTVAWRAGEVVADYHALPHPELAASSSLALQVALAPPFAPAEELDWQTVALTQWTAAEASGVSDPLRMQLGPLSLNGVSIAEPVRRGAPLVVRLFGSADAPESLLLAIIAVGSNPSDAEWQLVNSVALPSASTGNDSRLTLQWHGLLEADLPSGEYEVVAGYAGQQATCTWLARRAAHCVLGQVVLSDALLPPGAVQFGDKIAMLSVDVPEKQLTPGGELALTLTWQALASMDEDYTVFVQVLDPDDRIVGQVDAWPQQGTYPTSSWTPGEIVEDPYLVQLDQELPPGQYRLVAGWYLLETLRRLPVLDQDGRPVDDKIVVPGLVAPG